ncbi:MULTISPECIES: DUF896 domain-containing protein [unclassified Fusibacter]|uniref:DUF896 domain-containing protein n=1 Tax=unclassified Fusibacter TaxID=2624464 RepID=UPI00101333D9|nr:MULTISPECIES: DUF896 domain-containing protein [unclassified Fusibacter]MCK8061008.1 DUF896 domain-containing protein [Fusibacter sp. A2]NPE20538.1 DUF896 domain-containing protein [Fusibacter sp. A1]RXV63736.1 DUF896 domain-containing protein [Fusibacter sp. A1]
MLEKTKLDRLNEIARKKKVEPLSEEELKEQKELRDEYLGNLRTYVRGNLANVKYEKR